MSYTDNGFHLKSEFTKKCPTQTKPLQQRLKVSSLFDFIHSLPISINHADMIVHSLFIVQLQDIQERNSGASVRNKKVKKRYHFMGRNGKSKNTLSLLWNKKRMHLCWKIFGNGSSRS